MRACGSPIAQVSTGGYAENVTTAIDVSGAIGHIDYRGPNVNLGEGQQIASGCLDVLDASAEEATVRGETGAILNDAKEAARLDMRRRTIE